MRAPPPVGKISELSPAPDTRGLSERLRPTKNVSRAPQKHASQFSDRLSRVSDAALKAAAVARQLVAEQRAAPYRTPAPRRSPHG